MEGCDFWSVERQHQSGLEYAAACPTRHYARKNIGYLIAIQQGAQTIIETDDDNFPREEFWQTRERRPQLAVSPENHGWLNVYGLYSKTLLWPRGLPLDAIQQPLPDVQTWKTQAADCPIQQGLADENPDVDAIYRLLLPLPQNFDGRPPVALARGTWCPFNSQNTRWWRDAFPLLYLPAYCSFRMTDIWRSFVAQRIAWENGWSLLFHKATVWQDRNDHSLMRDFEDEVPGYLHNRDLCDQLGALSLKPGADGIPDNLRQCYEVFIRKGVVESRELPLLDLWLKDLKTVSSS